jgi:Lar family restriction alleviation protein
MWTLEHPVHPCPFCGSTQIVALSIGAAAGLLQCRACSAQGPIGQTQAQAVAAWQRRGSLVPQPCPVCGTQFQPRTRRQQYCQPQCRVAALTQERRDAHHVARSLARRLAQLEQREQARRHRAQERAASQAAAAQDEANRLWLLASS